MPIIPPQGKTQSKPLEAKTKSNKHPFMTTISMNKWHVDPKRIAQDMWRTK